MTTTGASPLIDDVAGEQADLVGAVAPDQVGVLLVGQRLDRGRVERLAPGREGQVHGELADDRLARAGRRRDQHAAAGLDGLRRLHLERGRAGSPAAPEGGELRSRVPLGRRSGEPLSRRGHVPRLRQRGQARSATAARRARPRASWAAAANRSPSAYDTIPVASRRTSPGPVDLDGRMGDVGALKTLGKTLRNSSVLILSQRSSRRAARRRTRRPGRPACRRRSDGPLPTATSIALGLDGARRRARRRTGSAGRRGSSRSDGQVVAHLALGPRASRWRAR